ncbi:MAG: molybdopterin molybdotransferase MoeA, partial [Nocardioidaceae bacterium]|nr:molybdopterin molybdotransferase MoeA [Nocardioidaceae bacterium]
QSLGRVLAAPVVARMSVPSYDQAAMDGFAVRAAEVAEACDMRPVVLPVVGSVAAGDPAPPLPPGRAIRIATGAALPAGADLVVPFEWTDAGSPVRIMRSARAGAHLRRAGEDVVAGEVALMAGSAIGPARIGLLTSIGVNTVACRRRPRLAVLSTGAELSTEPAAGPVAPPRVPDSNTATLLAAGRAAGCEVQAFGPVIDDVESFRDRLSAAAATADLIVTTGGISAGDHDVVKAALSNTGDSGSSGEQGGFWFGSVALKPGRPQGCGVLHREDGRRVPVVTLPGTPIAAAASFALFLVPAIRALVGQRWRPQQAVLATAVEGSARTVLLPAVRIDGGRVAPLHGHAGHSQRLLAAADALLVVPPTGKVVPAGTTLEILPMHLEEI